MGRSLRVEADGGSRGNPGVAGYGALVRDSGSGGVLVELAGPLGTASNNVAEYRGMLAGLRAARTIDPSADVEVGMDSKLVVEQMSGRWKIKHPDMQELARQGRDLVAEITAAGGSVAFVWIPRDANAHADALSNRGMDGEEVEEWREGSRGDHPPRRDTEPAAAQRRSGRDGPTLVVLVRHGDTEQSERAADRVAALVDDADVRVVTSDPTRDARTGDTVAERLAVAPHADADWDEPSEGETHEELTTRVVTAWERVVADGRTAVVACHRTAILVVLAHVLGLPRERMRRLAVDPGSLTALEVRPDGEALVAFTNRT
ncbi:reverse transcriptase-like protein [Janibacter sp. DB-40]|uniref:reverse transcriptase-like protein n=1 Tax=Janibacter sp. DB-40 TaxID=3028808 RepID=UPI00240635F6|nr:reverse transcriptase-like protein [Janibacter sp. DB-40]